EGIDGVGHDVVVHDCIVAHGVVRGNLALHGGDVGQPGSVHQITDGIDAGEVSLHLLIDAHTPTVVVESLLHQLIQPAGVGPAAHRYQDVFAAEGLFPFICLSSDLFHLAIVSDRLDLRSRNDINTAPAEDAHE